MAKKSLTDAATSKLARREEEKGETPGLLSPRKTQRLPKSFRLGAIDIERLLRLSKRLSEEAGRPITDTNILKGLLLLGEKTNARKLLTAIKDTVFESI